MPEILETNANTFIRAIKNIMKPIFTIHAGEYLVGSYIEENYKRSLEYASVADRLKSKIIELI